MTKPLTTVVVAAALLFGTAASARPASSRTPRADAAIERGLSFLLSQQRDDGSFRSDNYAAFKDGYALTPGIVKALLMAGSTPAARAAAERGVAFLRTIVGPDGKVRPDLSYPVYSAGSTLMVLRYARSAEDGARIDALVRFLEERQLAEANGWTKDDPSYGGWGYYHGVPRKPPDGQPLPDLLSSNLSSTLFAASALAMHVPDHPALARALLFAHRCQNFGPDPRWDDGGFFFTQVNAAQNKADGGTDAKGRTRYRSYGTTTADGARLLRALRTPASDRRLRAAERWLRSRFGAWAPPGAYGSEVVRHSQHYYWLWSVTHALRGARGSKGWATAVIKELARRQRPDGAWSNRYTDLREDEPLLATAFALGALGNARMAFAAR